MAGDAFHEDHNESLASEMPQTCESGGQFIYTLPTLSIATSSIVIAEQAQQLQALQTCLDLRDKYMLKSRQRLGDDPRDYDGVFPGVDSTYAGVSGFKSDMELSPNLTPSVQPFKPWKIYPKPPRPTWHPHSKAALDHSEDEPGDGFLFEDCEIPGVQSWSFRLDEKGVYQVYEVLEGKGEFNECLIFDSPSWVP